jgi:anti-sigma-K factor RskA
MRTAEAHTLIGAYVLDALDGPDRRLAERHLARCRACASEVRQLRAAAGELTLPAAAPPPPGLRTAVLAAVEGTAQLPPLPTGRDRARRRRRAPAEGQGRARRRRLTIAVAGTAAAVAFGALGGVALDQHHQLTVARARYGELRAAAATAALRTARALRGGGSIAVVTNDDRALIVARGLPPLPEARVYQLWLLGPSRSLSAGLVPGQAGDLERFVTVPPGLTSLAVTIEPAGGSPRPTTPPLASTPL